MNKLNHLAIIMDGNGRYAKKKGLPTSAGHYKGVEVLHDITIYANSLGIKALTVYAFSTENFKRSKNEVNYIMSLPAVFFDKYMAELMKNGVKINIIGERNNIPENTLKVIDNAINKTKDNKGIILTFAFNYGGRDEIVNACKNFAIDYSKDNSLKIDEESFKKYLFTSDLPEVDLLIRTGGQMRVSNFLLYQIAYSEIVVTDTLWPEFNNNKLDECISEYEKRLRNFGGRHETESN